MLKNIKHKVIGAIGVASVVAVNALVAAKAFAVSQFETATNAATLVVTDLGTDLRTLLIALIVAFGSLFIVGLVWRRLRRGANRETRVS